MVLSLVTKLLGLLCASSRVGAGKDQLSVQIDGPVRCGIGWPRKRSL